MPERASLERAELEEKEASKLDHLEATWSMLDELESKYPENERVSVNSLLRFVKEKVEDKKFEEALDIVTQLGDKILHELHRTGLQKRLEELIKLFSEQD